MTMLRLRLDIIRYVCTCVCALIVVRGINHNINLCNVSGHSISTIFGPVLDTAQQ